MDNVPIDNVNPSLERIIKATKWAKKNKLKFEFIRDLMNAYTFEEAC